jgi:hypothetical protein
MKDPSGRCWRRVDRAEDIGAAVAHLTGPGRRLITGAGIVVDRGFVD